MSELDMATTIRAFIAVQVPPLPALEGVLKSLAEMGSAVSQVDARNLHVTLKFLGETPAASVPQISEVIEYVADGEPAFDCRVEGIGAFPHERRPSVVWAGLPDAQPLVEIAGSLEQELQQVGLPRSPRSFQPHLTLARIRKRPPASLFELLRSQSRLQFGITRIDSIKLIQSELDPAGATYSVLASASLQPG